MKNEMVIKQEMEIIESNKCKFRKKLDMVQCEEKDLVELLENKKEATFLTTRLCNDHGSGLERLMDQRGHKQQGMSVGKQVHFDRGLEELLEQRAPCVIRTLSRKREFLSQDFSTSNYVYALIPGENLFKKEISVRENDLSIINGDNGDNFSVKQHEKVWSRILGGMDQEIVIQEVMQTGLSSTGIDVDGTISKPVKRWRCKLCILKF